LRCSGITFASSTLQTSWQIFFVIACAIGYHVTWSCIPIGHFLQNPSIDFWPRLTMHNQRLDGISFFMVVSPFNGKTLLLHIMKTGVLVQCFHLTNGCKWQLMPSGTFP
jgi:hypothetical protein